MEGKLVILNHPLISHKLSIIRDENTGTKDFRNTVSEIGKLMSFEISRDFPLKEIETNFDKSLISKTADSAKLLIMKLEEFKSVIALSAENRTVYTICRYVQELAQEFHSFYNSNRVIGEDKELMKSRLALIIAIQTTLKNALDILAVSAPERM